MRNETINTFAKLLSCFFLMSGLYGELCHGDTVAEICEVSPGKASVDTDTPRQGSIISGAGPAIIAKRERGEKVIIRKYKPRLN